ncbi:MAG: sigma-70 family RNA polymerase sigma factor [Lachnospiraceae bacterium]|nr:sigma-70 family RNA polymerase sigma factor [Lachnospiraceae bacterium]
MLDKDKSGLREIYDAYLDYIYRIVLGVVGRKEDAEDVTSEFFIKLWQNADKYKPGSGHKGYMATIARNMAIDFLRKNRHEVLETINEEDGEETSFESTLRSDDDTENTVIEEISLKEALDRLTPKQRQIVDLKILSEMTFQEISDSLGVPLGTVTWHYREAINKLRRCGYYEEGS